MCFKINKFSKFQLIFIALIAQNEAFLYINYQVNQTDFLGLRNLDEVFRKPEQHERQISQLDVFRSSMRLIRELTIGSYDAKKAFEYNLKLGKIQTEIPAETPFPCDLTQARSATPPKTVHELRPGDIDIIAAMGDSMSAGTSLMTESFLQIPVENRGLTFSGGGAGTWRKFLTLPNILKVFNPKLYGYAIGAGFTFHKTSRFNVAEPVGMSRDLVHQAKLLIKRMRQDPHVDFKRHWKLLTILVGSVDFCADLCKYDNVSIPLRYHEQDLLRALRMLRDNVPHLFVNLITAPNSIKTLQKMIQKISLPCYVIHRSFCPCVQAANTTIGELRTYAESIRLWQDVDAYVANLDEFNTDDFTVINHTFFLDPEPPMTPNGQVDMRYFAADCFHFSPLGVASLANSLWNSMLEPFGNKQLNFEMLPFKHFECPSLERPYLATKQNS